MELPNIAAYAYQDVHVWSALLTCLRPRFGDPLSLNQPETLARISGFLIVVIKKTICCRCLCCGDAYLCATVFHFC